MSHRTCLRCDQVKGDDQFYRRRDRVLSTCKTCMNWESSKRAQGLAVPPRRDGLDGTTRRCRICGVAKLIEAFKVRDKARGTRRTECYECQKNAHRARYHENKQAHRDRMRRALYGLVAGQYEEILQSQGGVCAICGGLETSTDRFTGKTRRLFVDHCHTTGAVRGLLCMRCNMGVGNFRDRPDLLKNAIEYLNKSAD